MSMFMAVNDYTTPEYSPNLEDVEYYVTKMQDSGSRVEIKAQSRRRIDLSLPDENVIEVTCGHLVGRLHRDRFYCPGIHRECIEVDGEFVSPKKFSILGDKQRLKDWKNAIRINNKQIRKFIDSGELTFWNHDSLCTGRCIARAPTIRPEGMPIRIDDKNPIRFETLTTTVSPTPDLPTQVSMMMVPESGAGGSGDDWDSSKDIKPDVEQLQAQIIAANSITPIITHPHPIISNVSTVSTISKSASYTYPVSSSSMTGTLSSTGLTSACEEGTDEDDRMLWKGIIELGLVDEFFREIKAALDVFKNDMIRRFVPLDASKKISVIVKELGLMSKLRYKLGAHKTEMDRQRQKLDREMEDLQRRVKEYEQKKAMLKRKSECFDQLIDITAMKKEEEAEDQLAPPVKFVKQNENKPTPMIIFPSELVMQSSDSVEVTLADSASNSELSTGKVMLLSQPENSDDRLAEMDCESGATKTEESNNDSNSYQENSSENSSEKGGNSNKVDSTTDEPYGNEQVANQENLTEMSVDNGNQNDNASSGGDSNSEDFTKIRLSKRKRTPRSFNSDYC